MSANWPARLTRDGAIDEFPLAVDGAMPSCLVADPDGALRFTLNQADVIGRPDPHDGTTTVIGLSSQRACAGRTCCRA